MKFIVGALVAVLGFASVNAIPDFGNGELHDDLQYFLAKIPMDDISAVIVQYAAEDIEFQEALEYVMSDEFKQFVTDVEAFPEVINLVEFLENKGIYANQILNKLNELLGIVNTRRVVAARAQPAISGGLVGLFNDVKTQISYDDVIHGYVYKMKTSAAFADFVAELRSDNFQGIVDAIYSHETFLNIRSFLVSRGVNVGLIEDVMFVVLGTQFPDLNAL